MNKRMKARELIDLSFEMIPLDMVERAYEFGSEIENITPLTFYEGECVELFYEDKWGDVVEFNREEDVVVVDVDGKKEIWDVSDLDLSEKMVDFPMWGELFMADGMMAEKILNNLEAVASCGFEIYEVKETGYVFLGVNGAGYDFVQAHFVPLFEELFDI